MYPNRGCFPLTHNGGDSRSTTRFVVTLLFIDFFCNITYATDSFTVVFVPVSFVLHRYAGLREDSQRMLECASINGILEIRFGGLCVQTESTGSTQGITKGWNLFSEIFIYNPKNSSLHWVQKFFLFP